MKFTKKRLQLWAILGIAAAHLTACGPAQIPPIVDIETNETAFLVPMEGESKEGQERFMSVDFLEQNKAPTKRVTLPIRKRSTGRVWFDYEWLPTLRVVTVNRTPVTREWTAEEGTGTEAKDQGIHVESKESIGFSVGVNLTASVTEEDAATFLYWYAGKKLAEVVDENVRGFVTSVLSREFGERDLMTGKGAKAEIFKKCFEETAEH